MKIYILLDNPREVSDMLFLGKQIQQDYELIYPSNRCKSIRLQITECINCINKSQNNDVIVCWYDFMGIICWWLCFFTRKKRNIVAINLLLKSKKTIKNKLARFLYKRALISKNFWATVTSVEYGKWLNKMLNINEHFTLLHDVYVASKWKLSHGAQIINKSVFCGGRNGRDWKFLFELANSMPDIHFNCVLTEEQYVMYKDYMGSNTNVHFEVSENDFMKLLCQSEMVVMPLDTEAPAGLIVMFQAAANNKLIITSDTVTTREYFAENRGVLCSNSLDEWKHNIRYYLDNRKEALKKAEAFKSFLERECSEHKYAEIVSSIVRDIVNDEL